MALVPFLPPGPSPSEEHHCVPYTVGLEEGGRRARLSSITLTIMCEGENSPQTPEWLGVRSCPRRPGGGGSSEAPGGGWQLLRITRTG